MEIFGIPITAWQLWLAAAIFFIILEIVIPGFVVMCVGIGCAFAAIAAGFGMSGNWQLFFFCFGGIASFATIRPIVLKTLYKKNELKTNVDFLIGRAGVVSEKFNAHLKLGRVKIDGDDWRSETIEEIELNEGDLVEIIRVESNTLIVKPKK